MELFGEQQASLVAGRFCMMLNLVCDIENSCIIAIYSLLKGAAAQSQWQQPGVMDYRRLQTCTYGCILLEWGIAWAANWKQTACHSKMAPLEFQLAFYGWLI